MSAAGFPNRVLLEPFVFRRDDDFPDESKAPIRVTGTTSWGASFRIAFSLAEPPHVSRLYTQLPVPGFLDRMVATPLSIVATHRHLALIRVATRTPRMLTVQNFFIFNANEHPSFSLKALPTCIPSPPLTIPAIVAGYLLVVVFLMLLPSCLMSLTWASGAEAKSSWWRS